nr:hypothetical protein [Planococcus glaciei]
MDTVQDVEIYLLSKKCNLTARRWAKKQAAQAADFGTAPDVERRSFKN